MDGRRGIWEKGGDILIAELRRAHEFLRMFTPEGPSELPRLTRPIYRGHAEADWSLVPPVFRDGNWLKTETTWIQTPAKTYRELIAAEFATIRDFFEQCDRQGLRLPEDSQTLREFFIFTKVFSLGARDDGALAGWPPIQIRSLLALAQHSGVPTRLLDWSWSPFVAAYFAARDVIKRQTVESDKRFAIWILDQHALKPQYQPRIAPGKEPVELVTAPGSEIINLRAQQGVFTLLRTGDIILDQPYAPVSLETLLESPYLDKPQGHGLLRKITLPHREAPNLLSALSQMGVDTASLFPGFAGVAEAMREDCQMSPMVERIKEARQRLMSTLEQDSEPRP